MDNTLNSNQIELNRLQDEVLDLNQRLEKLNQKFEKAESYKSHFISLITNEIVNPFTSILGLSKEIVRLKDGDMQRARDLAQIIHSEAFFLDFQLNNIFMAARLEAGEAVANPTQVDIKSVIDTVVNEFTVKSDEKELEIITQVGSSEDIGHFVTDPAILKSVALNLLSNAIKASYNNGKIVIKAWTDDGILYFSVNDYGVGIDPDKYEELFDRFKKLDDTINSINTGSGIGLPIVRGLLDLLHGTLNVESKLNSGSVFTVSIPAAIRTDCGFATDDGELFFDDDDDTESF